MPAASAQKKWLRPAQACRLDLIISWVFPKIGVAPNHPFVHRVFHEISHPFWGTIIFGNAQLTWKNPRMDDV